jgi:hypothetical protein
LLDKKLKESKEWNQVMSIRQSGDFEDIPEFMNKDYALSLLALTAELKSYPDSFLHAFT